MVDVVRRSLADLPHPSLDIFALRAPWCPLAARGVTGALDVDPGLLACWRMRGLGPVALPPEWTRGRSLVYRVDAVLAWLAARRGEPFDAVDAARTWLGTVLGIPAGGDDEVRTYARLLAEAEGPRAYRGDGVEFTASGWREYLASLLS